MNTPTGNAVVGSLLRTTLVDDASPIVYGVPDNLAVYSNSGESFSVEHGARRRSRRRSVAPARAARRAAARRTIRTSCRAARRSTSASRSPPRRRCSRGRLGAVTDEHAAEPANLIPPDQRPRVIAALRRPARPARVRTARGRRRHRAAAGRGRRAGRARPRRAVREQPDLARRDDRDVLRSCSTRS